MAVVFRARDERLDRTVALKLLAPALAADHDFRQRFIRESRAAARIDEPHVIPVFEAGEADGVLFIAMRYVRGGDVRSLIPTRGGLPAARVASIITQAAAALDAAHGEGLVHRDVKPANMLLDHRGGNGQPDADHVYLSDFGLSKAAMQTTGLTRSGTFLGTLDYIAPEQIEGKPVDGRADQYALACAAFELLCGRPPFGHGEAMAVMYAHLHAVPPPLTSLMPAVPVAADQVLRTALSKSPADRYATCGQFASAISRALGVAVPTEQAATGQAAMAGAAGHPQTEAARTPPPQALPGTGPLLARPAPGPRAQPRARRKAGTGLLVLGCALAAAAVVASLVLLRPGRPAAAGPGRSGQANTPAGRPGSPEPPGPSPSASGGAPRAEGAATRVLASADYRLVRRLGPATAGSISSVSWAAGGSLVATSDKNGATYLWNAATASPQGPPLPGPTVAYASAVSPDGTIVAAGYADGTIRVFSTAAARLLTTLPANASGSTPEINSLAFSPDGRTLAAADGNGYLDLWNLRGGQVSLRTRLHDPASSGIYSVVFGARGMLAAGDYLGNVYIWNLASLGQVGQLTVPGGSCTGSTICAAISGLAFSGNGSVLAAGNLSGNAELWSTSGRSVIDTARHGSPMIWGMSFSGQTLAVACRDGQLYLWRVAPGTLTATGEGALADPAAGGLGIGAVGFSADGRYLVTGDTSGSAYLWRHVTPAPGAAGQPWTGSRLTITPRSLGAVRVGSTPAQASAAAREGLRPVGDGVWSPHGVMTSGLAIAVGSAGTVSCVSASEQPGGPAVETPQGFRLGGTLAQLKGVYGASLRFVPAPAGGISPVPGYVVRLSGGNLAFWLSGGVVRRISAGPGVLPSTGCS